MTEPLNGEKEKETPAIAAENKPTEVTPEAFQKLQETVANLNKKLEEKETQAAQLTEKLRQTREANKPLIIVPPLPASKPEIDDIEPDEVDLKIKSHLGKEKEQDYINRVNRCFNKFSAKAEEWDQEIDDKFREISNKTILGFSEDEVMENFQLIYNGIVYPRKAQSKEEDKKKTIDVGDGGNEPTIKPKPGKNNWATKKLDRFQRVAAEHFTSSRYGNGEPGYRKKMQAMEDEE